MMAVWQSLVGPAVIAALLSLIGIYISNKTVRKMHLEKLDQEKLALKERLEADARLAERRTAYEYNLAARKRLAEFAEQVLSDFYQMREVIQWARNPAAFGGEGKTRPGRENDAESIRDRLDSFYVAIERIEREKELYSRLMAAKYRFQANFGKGSNLPFDEFARIIREISVASWALSSRLRDRDPMDSFYKEMESRIWKMKEENDDIQNRMDEAVNKIESFCVPVLKADLSFTEATGSPVA